MTWHRGSHLEQTADRDSDVKFNLILFIIDLNLKLAHLPPPPSPASQCLQSVLLSASVPLSWLPPDKHNIFRFYYPTKM